MAMTNSGRTEAISQSAACRQTQSFPGREAKRRIWGSYTGGCHKFFGESSLQKQCAKMGCESKMRPGNSGDEEQGALKVTDCS